MTDEEKQKMDEYDKNTHRVSVKTNKKGYWCFVDANGNPALTLDESGQLVPAIHDKSDAAPTLTTKEIVSEEQYRGATIERSIFMAKLDGIPLVSSHYTADMFESLMQRKKIVEEIETKAKLIKAKFMLTESEDRLAGFKTFVSYLDSMKTALAIYFSENEHQYLKALLEKSILEIIPDSFKKYDYNSFLDNYLNEVAIIREQLLTGDNKDVKYISSLSDNVAQNTGSFLSFGYKIVDIVDRANRKNANIQDTTQEM